MDLKVGSHTQPSWPRANPRNYMALKDSPWFSLTEESLGFHWPLKRRAEQVTTFHCGPI